MGHFGLLFCCDSDTDLFFSFFIWTWLINSYFTLFYLRRYQIVLLWTFNDDLIICGDHSCLVYVSYTIGCVGNYCVIIKGLVV